MKSLDRGQIGIGTLIVFIALVLVAAIAAGVLINSADLLQERGENTSEDSVSEVSDQIVVTSTYGTVLDTRLISSLDGATNDDVNDELGTAISDDTSTATETDVQGYPVEVTTSGSTISVSDYGAVTGEVNSGNRGPQVHELKLNVRIASGAEEIDLREATIDFLGEDDTTFTFSETTLDPRNNTGATHGEDFVVDGLTDSNFATILRDGDRAQITLGLLEENVSDGAITDNEVDFDEALNAGETAELRLVTNGGAETFVEINVPETLDRDTGETVSV